MVFILCGIAVLAGSLNPFAVVVLFAVAMEIVFIRVEEQMLEKTFGQDWKDYREKVRRWL